MSDDLGKKVQQIAQMLGQENMPDNVKELITLLANSMGSKESSADQAAPPNAETAEKPAITEPVVSTEMLDTARKTLDRLNTGNDPRINLLHAIKPFMNSKRQKKIGNCIQLLQVASLSRLLNEHEK
jgi:hypothetical protein